MEATKKAQTEAILQVENLGKGTETKYRRWKKDSGEDDMNEEINIISQRK